MSAAAVEVETSTWGTAMLAAALFSIDPIGTGGVSLRALVGPVREQWLTLARELLPPSVAIRRIPLHVTDGRLLGGLDLAATLRAGQPVAERGILAESNDGVVVLSMAERLAASTVARLTAALDTGEVLMERDGLARRTSARFGAIALDEGMADDERPPAALLDRLAFHVDLSGIGIRDIDSPPYSANEIAVARARLPAVCASEDIIEALCAAAMALGILSIRASLLALRASRAAAALAGRATVDETDASLAARLVLAPRAIMLSAPEREDDVAQTETEPESDSSSDGEQQDDRTADADRPLEDLVLAAAQAAIPADLLARLRLPGGGRSRSPTAGKAGVLRQSGPRGRPAGVCGGEPRAGARLNLVETLRAAVPWQRLRRGNLGEPRSCDRRPARIEVRRDDFRVTRFKQRTETTTIFVVDASGSAALHRLAEAKGAVELLLADCYVRRDRVALIAFRGRGAELLLPPTRSLVRAKRGLASLPGGGGTPLAAGIAAARELADTVARRGETPIVIFLTDGRANIARDGGAGRPRAEEEALTAARSVRAASLTALLVDTSPRPQPLARNLAAELGATYLALPYADAAVLSQAVLASAPSR